MGSLDWGFVSSVLSLKPAEIDQLGVDESFLVDADAVGCLRFIKTYLHETGTIPDPSVVKEKFPSFVLDDSMHVKWIIKELRGRKLFNVVADGLRVAAVDLREGTANDALETMERIMRNAEVIHQQVNVHDLQKMGDSLQQFYEDIKGGRRGIEFPWEALNLLTRGMWPETVTFFAARPGTGKCVAKGTEIPDPATGSYRPIEDVVSDAGTMVFTRDDGHQIRLTSPSGRWMTGTKECLRIMTRSGLELVVTPEHPLSTVDGWQRADQVREGDFVETVKWMPEPLLADDGFPDEYVDLMAALLAEGGCTTDPPKFSNEDIEIVGRVRMATEMLGAKMVQYRGMKSFEYALTSGNRDGEKEEEDAINPVRLLMKMWGLGYEKSVDKVIPDRIFALSNRLLARFIGMFWSCDGSVEARNLLTLTLGSERMVRQFKRLLLRFGITSRVAYKPVKYDGGINDSWRLTIHSTCYRLFREQIPLVGQKAALLRNLPDGENPNVDNIPLTPALKSKIIEAMNRGRERGVQMLALRDALGWTSYIDRRKLVRRRTISRRMLGTFAEVFDAPDLGALCLSHWDEVVEIEDVGEREVYDLTVDDTHNFVANDIVAHNTFLAIIIARQAHIDGKRVLIISPEMNAMEIGERFFSIEAGVSYADVVSGSLSQVRGEDGKSAEELYFESMQGSGAGPFIIDDEDRLTPQAMEATISSTQPELLAVDAAYLLKIGKGSRYERIIDVVEWLRHVSKKFHMAVLATSQLTKEAEKKGGIGQLSVALTDTINWDAHNLFALKQTPEMRHDGRLNIVPIKVRRMARMYNRGEIDIHWDMDRMVFDEIAGKEEFQDDGYKEFGGKEMPF